MQTVRLALRANVKQEQMPSMDVSEDAADHAADPAAALEEGMEIMAATVVAMAATAAAMVVMVMVTADADAQLTIVE